MAEAKVLNDSQAKFITEFNNGSPDKPFTKMYTFIKNDQAMTRYAFKEVYDNLREYLDNLGLNYGILLTPDGTFVFTEEKVKFDALMVKLSTGVNFGKQVNNIKGDMDLVNRVLGR
jgi:hypothetical protein